MDPPHRREAGHADAVQPPEAGQGHGDRRDLSWLTVLGFLFLTFDSGVAIYRSEGDYTSIAFVAFSYVEISSCSSPA